MFEDYNFGENVIEKYIDFEINENFPINKQLSNLKEDMLQIAYKSGYTIDIGWYPEFNKNGAFTIVVIKSHEWTKPILKHTCKDLETLKSYLDKYVCYIAEN